MKTSLLAAALSLTLGTAALAQTMAPNTMAPNTMSAHPSTMGPVMRDNIDKHKTKALPANSMAPNGPTVPAVGADPMKENLTKPQ